LLYPFYRVQAVLAIRFYLFHPPLDPESDQQADGKTEHTMTERPVEPCGGIIPGRRCLCKSTEKIKYSAACCINQYIRPRCHLPAERDEKIEKYDSAGDAGRIMKQDACDPVI